MSGYKVARDQKRSSNERVHFLIIIIIIIIIIINIKIILRIYNRNIFICA